MYKFLFLNNKFKLALLKRGFYNEVFYMDAIADAWSVFSLPGLSQGERLARAFKTIIYFHVLMGPKLFTIHAATVTTGLNDNIGVVMDNLRNMLTNLCAYVQICIATDGSWRTSFVPKCISNDDIESYFSTWVVS